MKFVFRPLFFLSCRPYLSNKTLKMIINRIIELFIVSILKLHLLSKTDTAHTRAGHGDFVQTTVVRAKAAFIMYTSGGGGDCRRTRGGCQDFWQEERGMLFFSPLKEKAFVIFFNLILICLNVWNIVVRLFPLQMYFYRAILVNPILPGLFFFEFLSLKGGRGHKVPFSPHKSRKYSLSCDETWHVFSTSLG